MPQAKMGDTVRVHYRGSLKDGSVFDESEGRHPLELKVGSGQVIPGFEQALVGMWPGDIRTINIPAAEAYGLHQAEMVVTIPRDGLPADVQPQIGEELQVNQDDDNPLIVRVAGLTDTTITLDGNHPLAGEDLTFRIELVKIV